jgi:hypothetical protein
MFKPGGIRLWSGSLILICCCHQTSGASQPSNEQKSEDSGVTSPKQGLPEALAFVRDAKAMTVTKVFTSGFESEDDFKKFSITPQKHLGSTSHCKSDEHVRSGHCAHKAWIEKSNEVLEGQNTNHRGYPTVQLYKRDAGVFKGRVVVDVWVWLDVQLSKEKEKNWFSFATLTAYSDDRWMRCVLVNLSNEGIVNLMHVPIQNAGNRDIFQTDSIKFPMKKWTQLTVYLDMTANNEYKSPYAKVWQDGQLVSAARTNFRMNPSDYDRKLWPKELANWDGKSIEGAEQLLGYRFTDGLAQAHFGMYAPPLLTRGCVYNDDLSIFELK